MLPPAIHLSNLTKRYAKIAVVDALTLDVAEGSIYGFLGPNGAGKSTTINRQIQMYFGSLSGTGFSLGLFALAVLIAMPAPLITAFLLRSENPPFSLMWSAGVLGALCVTYIVALHSSGKFIQRHLDA